MVRPFGSILLCAAASLTLSGCAALAVPVGTSLLLGTRIKSENARDAALAQEAQASASAESPAAAIPADAQEQDGELVLTQLDALPAPSTNALPDTGRSTYSELQEAALAIARRDPFAEEKRLSAILSDPASLEPERVPCAFAQTAVLIDLDPADGEAPLGDTVTAPADLAEALATLRAQEVAVLWLTRHTADRAGAVRRTLRNSGLDPDGQDELYLVRYEDETKATRRAAAADDYCIVAMLGDEKRDFDELFAFLKEADAAFALDTLFGEAWFLGPPPLTASPTTTPPSEPKVAAQD
ncbi:hypothetical protein [Alteriqipengyuania lutimaris]|uniref:Acid phosphatase n=1 Tax=Alteriqipengyuania lutimaris TaxID=1538146 RepID=A0A395LI21_9SPHN|nr:hypothetical protein [Alteriqipengyuania lutimaris]MBB3034614.1 hypothetical protein [Alteriqipengyuania lutimaris]RDS76512.1 hypothetical protein DL238_02100 [Alteriqipengyuania lutimaris]